MAREPEFDTICRKRATQLTQARLALSSAVWYVARAVPPADADAFQAAVADLRHRLDDWNAECQEEQASLDDADMPQSR